jgi:hypothetical protein
MDGKSVPSRPQSSENVMAFIGPVGDIDAQLSEIRCISPVSVDLRGSRQPGRTCVCDQAAAITDEFLASRRSLRRVGCAASMQWRVASVRSAATRSAFALSRRLSSVSEVSSFPQQTRMINAFGNLRRRRLVAKRMWAVQTNETDSRDAGGFKPKYVGGGKHLRTFCPRTQAVRSSELAEHNSCGFVDQTSASNAQYRAFCLPLQRQVCRSAAKLKPSSGRILQIGRRTQVLSAQFFRGTTPKLFAPAVWLTSFAPQAMRTLSYFLISQHLGSFSEVLLLPSNQ